MSASAPRRTVRRREKNNMLTKLSNEQIREIERRFGDVRDMGDHYIVSVDGNGSEDETEAILIELQQFLGSTWICEWTGCGNTDSYGCTTEDISVSPTPPVR